MVQVATLEGIRKANNAGIVTTTGTPTYDLLHQLPLGRSCVIRKIMAYAPAGADITLQFGTINATPAFVALMPIFLAVAGLDNEWPETDIPAVEWIVNNSAGAAFRSGDIYVVTSIANAVIALEVEEFGA